MLQNKLNTLLENTFNHFSKDPKNLRSVKTVKGRLVCVFQNEHGNRCAIGMNMDTNELKTLKNLKLMNLPVEVLATTDIFEYLNISQYPVDFLTDLQKLHDNRTYWTNDAPTEKGVAFYQTMKQKIRTNKYRLEAY